MEIFEDIAYPDKNLLPYDGVVNYYGKIFGQNLADQYFKSLVQNVGWAKDKAIVFGKQVITKRKVAWYGDNHYSYTYSGITKTASKWSNELLKLKTIVEEITNESFNSCLLNLYHSGDEGMAWHSDAEKELKKNGAIASLSFGAPRKFAFKHKQTGEKVTIRLEHGGLLIMKDITQTHWLHSLPKSKKVTAPRINLTFREIIQSKIAKQTRKT